VKTTAVAAALGPGGQGLLFPHGAQAIRITRTRTTRTGGKTKRTTETVYAITSLSARDATGDQIAWPANHDFAGDLVPVRSGI
jgi:hypothetical protein